MTPRTVLDAASAVAATLARGAPVASAAARPGDAPPPEADLFRRLAHFDGARAGGGPKERLERVRAAARALRDDLLAGPTALFYRSKGLVRVPYPTRYALLNACSVPTPLLHIVNRMFVVQWRAAGGSCPGRGNPSPTPPAEGSVKTLLVSPSDVEANRETPFWKRMTRLFGPFEATQRLGRRLLAPVLSSVEGALAECGLRPSDVDYIAYDHLHTQDVRRWLGADGRPALFPNAKLLVMRAEWESVHGLVGPQLDWYCPGGVRGLDPAKVLLLDGDVLLGDGVAVVRTPGHTEGNMSFAVRTPEGVMVTSENGVGPDSYAPLRSRIPGLARYARESGMEVVLNGNTLEVGLDQYISMIQEKELAGPSQRRPEFPNVVASSELTSYWAFPGITPTFRFGDLSFGGSAARAGEGRAPS